MKLPADDDPIEYVDAELITRIECLILPSGAKFDGEMDKWVRFVLAEGLELLELTKNEIEPDPEEK